MEDFSVSVAKWVKKAKGNADFVFQQIALDALARVKELTPVRTGYLKAGWQASLGSTVAPGQDATTDSATVIAQASIGDTIVIFNPVVYARRIEYGFHGVDSLGRHYHEKGRHMMQQTISEIPSIAAKVLASVKK